MLDQLSLGQFSRTASTCCIRAVPCPYQLNPRWPIRVCEKESTFSPTEEKKINATNQSTNKEQITATANSILQRKTNFHGTKEEKNERDWNWFQGRFSASNFPGQLFRWRTPTRNKIPFQKPKSRWGLVGVSWAGLQSGGAVGVFCCSEDCGSIVESLFGVLLIFLCKDKIINS